MPGWWRCAGEPSFALSGKETFARHSSPYFFPVSSVAVKGTMTVMSHFGDTALIHAKEVAVSPASTPVSGERMTTQGKGKGTLGPS